MILKRYDKQLRDIERELVKEKVKRGDLDSMNPGYDIEAK